FAGVPLISSLMEMDLRAPVIWLRLPESNHDDLIVRIALPGGSVDPPGAVESASEGAIVEALEDALVLPWSHRMAQLRVLRATHRTHRMIANVSSPVYILIP